MEDDENFGVVLEHVGQPLSEKLGRLFQGMGRKMISAVSYFA
jgi:hypothetical protein